MKLTPAQAVEFIEATYFMPPDMVTATHVEAFVSADVEDVRTDLDQFAAFIGIEVDPESIIITPDVIEDMGVTAAKIIIRTE